MPIEREASAEPDNFADTEDGLVSALEYAAVLGANDPEQPELHSVRIEGGLIEVFDGVYSYCGEANNRPHWKSHKNMHLYWGPQLMWLLRSKFDPENPTASAFCESKDLVSGMSNWHWSSGGEWVEEKVRGPARQTRGAYPHFFRHPAAIHTSL